MIFEDEASFRQDSTLCRTWSRRGCQPIVPVTGDRNSVKVFGCVDIVKNDFKYMFDDVFNAATYLVFLETTVSQFFKNGVRVHYIQDNASYHKDKEIWQWFKENRKWIEVYNLPSYCPELNAAEPLWKYTRKSGTHNKQFNSKNEIIDTLDSIFEKIQDNPDLISGYTKYFL